MEVLNKYKYVLMDRFGIIETVPLGESNFTIAYDQETDGKYFYSKEFQGKITFTGEAYRRLKLIEGSIYICTQQRLQVFRICDTVETLIFDGYFKLTEGDWNLDLCKVVLKFEKSTPDKCLQNNKSIKINVLQEISQKIAVKMGTAGGVFEYRTCHKDEFVNNNSMWGLQVWCNSNGSGSTYATTDAYDNKWTILTNNVNMDGSIGVDPGTGQPTGGMLSVTTKWVREVVTVPCGETVPNDWLLIEDNCGTLGTKKYAKIPTLYNCQYTYQDEYNFSSNYECQLVGGNATTATIDNGVLLKDILLLMVNRFCPGLQVVSDFFQINPQNPSTINYVTGALTLVNKIVLFQKSDVKRPTAFNNATKAEITFDKLMEALSNMFNVFYSVENNVFRLEHISWFSRNAGFNLTLPKYAKFLKGKNNYTYDIEDIPQKEIWKFKEQLSYGEWVAQIDYSNACAIGSNKNNEKTYLVDELMTDVELCLNNSSADSNVVEDAGFVMIATKQFNNDYYIITEGGRLNNSLAWSKLVQRYHFHNRPINRGNFNGTMTTFLSTKPFKKGDKISIPLECGENFDPNNTMLTPLGIGIVDKAKFNLKTCMLDVELAYNVFENLTTNEAPILTGASLQTYKNVPLIFPINASDSDGIIMQIGIAYQAYNGTVTILSTTQAKYTPNLDFIGNDYFGLIAYDDWSEASPQAGFSVSVLPPNQPPVAQPESYNVFHNEPFTTQINIFANDSDDVGFTLVNSNLTTAQGVSIVIDSNGNFSYSPPSPTFEGPDTFTYTIQDNAGLQSSAIVSLIVAFKNKPIAVDDVYNTLKNVALNTDGSLGKEALFYNDYTPDGLSYTYTCTVETKPTAQGGTVSIQSNGLFTYTPPNNFTGADTFTYTVHNINGSDVGLVTIQVLPTIYVQLVQNDFKSTPNIIYCGNPPQAELGGNMQTRDIILKFWQDAAKTIPYDVTGLNFRVNIREQWSYQYNNNPPNNWTSDWLTDPLSSTQTMLYDDYIVYNEIGDCNGPFNGGETTQVTVSLRSGNYVIVT